ncbi:MAG: ribulokinase [Victivallaceae bacterium]|nr:ribulokinase [Victivallaceae bacterium]
MHDYVIGVDYGSDSVRALLVNAKDGSVLAGCVHNYQRWGQGRYCDPANSRFRQHPLDYIEGLEAVVKGVLDGKNNAFVRAINFDTTGSTVCAVDADGVPLALHPEFADDPDAMFHLWKDHTAIEEAARITEAAKKAPVDYTMYEGGTYSSEWFWSKILHMLRVNEKVRHAARGFVEHCDWMSFLLTGNTDYRSMLRSRCAAGHKAMWHESWGGLPPEEFFRSVDPLLAGVRTNLYRHTSTADTVAGTISPQWAQRLQLTTGVRIGIGAFDAHMGAVGAGIAPGQLVKVFGTSTCDIIVARQCDHCVRGICGQVDGSVLPGMIGLEAGQAAFGDIYAWFKRLLSYSAPLDLPALERDAAKVPVGAHNVMALDWHNGRRTPDANTALTGALFGLNLGSDAPTIYRALVESTVFGARRIAERFAEEAVPVEEVIAIGGISRKSPFVMQMSADVLRMPIKVVASDQACALGAAMFAAVNGGIYSDLADAVAAMNSGYDKTYLPRPEVSAQYDLNYKRYLALGAMWEKESTANVR